MLSLRKSLILIGAIGSLGACQGMDMKFSDYFRNHAHDYLTTGVIAPLAVPEGLSYHVDNTYPLLECLPQPGSVEPPPLCPPNFEALT